MNKLNIAYLIVMRSFPGLLKQISYENQLASEMSDVSWQNFTFLDDVDGSGSAERLPGPCSGVLGRKLFAWLWLLRNASRFDLVIVRHMEFDPFAVLFAWFVPNRVLVHHSKEVIELTLIRGDWRGKLASLLERFSGRVSVRTSRAIMGVTHELSEYQKKYRRLPDDFPTFVFPNGVIVDTIAPLADERASDRIEIVFMAGSFALWHGLDLLLEAFRAYLCDGNSSRAISLHLVGNVGDEYLELVDEINALKAAGTVTLHGRLQEPEYRKIMARCCLGIGSLAMDRIDMVEGATLKVREMLAMGLPVYSGHVDTALPVDFSYYLNGKCSFDELVEFADLHSASSRNEVRAAARPYIEKARLMKNVVEFLQGLKDQDEKNQ